jgi:hypothetical protein
VLRVVTLPQVSLASLLFPKRRVGWLLNGQPKPGFLMDAHGVLGARYGHAPEDLRSILEEHRQAWEASRASR